MKKIGITVIARMFGISPEAIRKYEKQGIILSQRDQDNNFRRFNLWDIAHLFRARLYTMCGFSLKETTKMLSISNLDEAENIIKNKEEDLVRQILVIQRQLETLRNMKSDIAEMLKGSTRLSYTFEQSPTVYFYDFMDDQALDDGENTLRYVSEWIERLPFVFLGLRFEYESDKKFRSVMGVCATEEDRKKYMLSNLPYTYCVKGGMNLTTTLVGTYSNPLNRDSFQDIVGFLRSKNFRIAGEIWGEVRYSAKIDNEYKFYHKIWIPIELA